MFLGAADDIAVYLGITTTPRGTITRFARITRDCIWDGGDGRVC